MMMRASRTLVAIQGAVCGSVKLGGVGASCRDGRRVRSTSAIRSPWTGIDPRPALRARIGRLAGRLDNADGPTVPTNLGTRHSAGCALECRVGKGFGRRSGRSQK